MNRKLKTKAHTDHPVLVKNYGLYWDREFVDWKKKVLCGKRKKRAGKINFWSQCGIYVLYSKDNAPVYFGQAGVGKRNKLGTRLRQHTDDDLADLWTKFSWFGFQAVRNTKTVHYGPLRKLSTSQSINTHLEVNLLEAILISILPTSIMNKQDGKWKKIRAHRYIQDLNDNVKRKNDKEYGALRTLEEQMQTLVKHLMPKKRGRPKNKKT